MSRLPARSALDGRHRRPAPLDTRPVPRFRPQSLRKKRDKQALVSLFWQGQKDLVSAPLRSARSLRATGTHSPLGTRFWSGCGRTRPGTGKGQCYPVLPNKSQKSGAGLVLTPDFAAIRLSFGLRIDSRLAGKILDNLSIGKDDLSFAIGGNVLVMSN